MEQDAERQDTGTPTEAGTPEGRAWARRVLDEGRARMSEQDWAALREQFGVRARRVA